MLAAVALAGPGLARGPGGLARRGLRRGYRPRVPQGRAAHVQPGASRGVPAGRAGRYARPDRDLHGRGGRGAGGRGPGRRPRRGFWPAGLAIALAALWYSATPGPTVDGWYGLGWRTIARCPCAVAGCARSCSRPRSRWPRSSAACGLRAGEIASGMPGPPLSDARSGGLWIAALVLAVARQFDIPGVEPAGYWPRWAMIWSLLAFDLGLLIEAGAAAEFADEPVGLGLAGDRRSGWPWWPSGSP